MRGLRLLALVALPLALGCSQSTPDADTATTTQADANLVTFKVTGMS
ncbi:MAG: hypothetical protein N2C14_01895 [Planctomycetales bacterium]